MNRAPVFSVIECPGSSRVLAFGLRWLALVGSNVPALARSRGRRLGASHYVVGGSPATVAGYGRERKGWPMPTLSLGRRRGRVRHVYAAAQMYAVLYPDGGYSVVALPDGRHWLVAGQGGTVLSQTDKLFSTRDDAMDALARLMSLRPDLPERDASEAYSRLLQAAEPAARLVALPSRWQEMPRAVRVFAGGVALSVLGPGAWNALSQRFSAAPAKSPETTARVSHPAQVGTLNGTPAAPGSPVRRGPSAHDPAELGRVLAGIVRLPVQVRGWALRRAHCDAGVSQWTCAATYVRAHPQATNLSLHAALPADRNVSFKPLEEAMLSWRLPSNVNALADLALPRAREVDTDLVAVLQRLRPAFTAIALTPPTPLPAAPGADTHAAPSPPIQAPLVRKRGVTLHGPLRSFALLSGQITVARWSRLAVELQPQQRPSLAASVLVAELNGELYEQE